MTLTHMGPKDFSSKQIQPTSSKVKNWCLIIFVKICKKLISKTWFSIFRDNIHINPEYVKMTLISVKCSGIRDDSNNRWQFLPLFWPPPSDILISKIILLIWKNVSFQKLNLALKNDFFILESLRSYFKKMFMRHFVNPLPPRMACIIWMDP